MSKKSHKTTMHTTSINSSSATPPCRPDINPQTINARVSPHRDPRVRLFYPATRVVTADPGHGKINQPQALLDTTESACTLCPAPKGQQPPSIVLDFGQELNGGVSIDVIQTGDAMFARARLTFGESVSETLGQPNGDHAFHQFTLDFPNTSKQEIGQTGFRFLRVELLDPETPITIRNIHAVGVELPLPALGSFACSDPLINDIWLTGARTVQLCCQDYIFDGIKRDRMVWMGDIHPQIHVIAYAFGVIDSVPDSLNILKQRWDADKWMNGQAGYNLWWIISIWQWYIYTGDRDFLADQVDYLQAMVDHLLPFSKHDSFPGFGDEKLYLVDWATANDPVATQLGLHAQFLWAMQLAGQIANELKLPQLAKQCDQAISSLKAAALPDSNCKQVQALRALTGLTTFDQANRCLADQPCHGLSPWFGYYVLQARAQANDIVGCLDLIRDYWGGMIQLGATSFWEHFDTAWMANATRIDELPQPGKKDVHADYGDHCYQGLRHSLCHGWGAGPTAWLSQHVLGVTPTAPGYKKAAIAPKLGDLQFAAGSVPTPHGIIHVEHQKDAQGNVKTHIDAPKEIDITQS